MLNSYENDWLVDNKFQNILETTNESDDLYFIVDDDIVYCLSDLSKLKQVEILEFNNPIDDYDEISEFIDYYLENIRMRTKSTLLASTNKLKQVNNLDKSILEYQNKRVHISQFSNIYNEIMMQNSNNFFKYFLENSTIFRYSMIIFRTSLTFEL
jgi:hypothetical protein